MAQLSTPQRNDWAPVQILQNTTGPQFGSRTGVRASEKTIKDVTEEPMGSGSFARAMGSLIDVTHCKISESLRRTQDILEEVTTS